MESSEPAADRLRRIFVMLSCTGASAGFLLAASGCSVVRVNGSLATQENALCVTAPAVKNPEVHGTLVKLLKKKGFDVKELAHGTPPGRCAHTLVYAWAREQYYIPAYVKQYAINIDVYVKGDKYANASFDPMRNLVSTHVRYVRFSRYLARVLDRLFPGRLEIGA